jgi:hypothetical protein
MNATQMATQIRRVTPGYRLPSRTLRGRLLKSARFLRRPAAVT